MVLLRGFRCGIGRKTDREERERRFRTDNARYAIRNSRASTRKRLDEHERNKKKNANSFLNKQTQMSHETREFESGNLLNSLMNRYRSGNLARGNTRLRVTRESGAVDQSREPTNRRGTCVGSSIRSIEHIEPNRPCRQKQIIIRRRKAGENSRDRLVANVNFKHAARLETQFQNDFNDRAKI
ncbi:hypothetical protein PUN28_020785 [Cardiocondyla obscurior]|uniref:Uncharacterized protein n=1 Tax=Cardiocondyla obscurior TaxID=286306 RepID=A0AAW2E790_9HYME